VSSGESTNLKSQIVTLNSRVAQVGDNHDMKGRGQHPKYAQYAFTEQGVAMLSSVLRSQRAIQVNIAIMRAFVKLREILSAHKELAKKLSELEQKIERHDKEIVAIFQAIRQLMAPPPAQPKRKIGF
jgi:phage regulator Rha-like protein